LQKKDDIEDDRQKDITTYHNDSDPYFKLWEKHRFENLGIDSKHAQRDRIRNLLPHFEEYTEHRETNVPANKQVIDYGKATVAFLKDRNRRLLEEYVESHKDDKAIH